MAIDRLITNTRFNGSRSLSAKREIIKNKGIVRKKAILLVKNILNRKKKKTPTNIFIIIIVRKLEGVVNIAKEMIILRSNAKKISFFPYFSLASLISFYYNWKLWLKQQ